MEGTVDEIKKEIESRCEKAVGKSATKIRRRLHDRINSFYNSYTPKYYVRTGKLGHNILYSEHNGLRAKVYLTPENLSYSQHPLMYRPDKKDYVFVSAMAEPTITFEAAISGSHGGKAQTNPIWDDKIDSDAYVCEVIKKSLKEVGL